MIEVTRKGHIDLKTIITETEKDPELKLVKKYITKTWPKMIPKALKRYWMIRNELTIHEGCLLRGDRVITPTILRKQILKYLHLNHSGIVATKAYARSYTWWPHIDDEIESMVSNCNRCQINRNNPPKAPIQNWEIPTEPWSRLHIDFAGPFKGQIFFIIVDSRSKWIEVKRIASMSTKNVIEEFRKLFAAFGVPKTIVSDNDTSFKSEEMAEFLKNNGIEQIFVAPYHQASNGRAERAVQTTKRTLEKLIEGTWETKLSRFLFRQHTTPSVSTGKTPAEILFGRKLRTPLDLLLSKTDDKHPEGLDTSKETSKCR